MVYGFPQKANSRSSVHEIPRCLRQPKIF